MKPIGENARNPLLRQVAEAIKVEWYEGTSPDTSEALSRHPELAEDRVVCLDLALEQYLLLQQTGQAPDPETFCGRFPAYRSSLRRLIDAHGWMRRIPGGDLPPVRWPLPGEQFGDFTLLRELGRGAFSRVFLATEASTGDRAVAVKFTTEGDEARMLGRLVHPNIVPILSAHPVAGLTAVCMPFLGAATLEEVRDYLYPTEGATAPSSAAVLLESIAATVRPGDPAVDPPVLGSAAVLHRSMVAGGEPSVLRQGTFADGVLYLAAQLARALAFLHERHICHRDLKPSNILLGPGGEPLLLDFNLSADSRSHPARLGGTVPYMAPEQLRAVLDGQFDAGLDGRADLFSLGVLLYELLTGQYPFAPVPPPGRPVHEMGPDLLERQRAGCRPLSSLCPQLPADMAALIDRCLAFEPSGRPASAAELATGLERHFSRPRRLRRWLARRPRLLAGVACLLLTLAGTGALSWASLPSAGERAYRAGRSAYIAGDYRDAVGHFKEAVQAGPSARKARVALAWAHLRSGEYEAALAEFTELNRSQPEALTLVGQACCFDRANNPNPRRAADCYNRAFEAGERSVAVINNRAYYLIQLGHCKEAVDGLEEVFRQSKDVPLACYYNRAWAHYRQSLNKSGPLKTTTALEDIQHVLDHASTPTQTLYLDAAHIFTLAAVQGGKGAEERAVNCLRQAREHGASDDDIANGGFSKEAIEAVRDVKRRHAPSTVRLRLIEPTPDLPE
jgi:serine/threonine protein kinase/Tfp pilus assembly protein PilF